MTTTKKPTPAQLKWLRAIEKGGVYRSGHSWVNSMRNHGRAGGAPSQSNYVMTVALHDAGWIEERKDTQPHGPFKERYPLDLTDAGRFALLPARTQADVAENADYLA